MIRFLLLSFAILMSASFAEVAHQERDGIIFIENKTANSGFGTARATFKLTKPGKYSLQLVHEKKKAGQSVSASAKISGRTVGGTLERKELIKDGVVSVFKDTIEFTRSGTYTVEVFCKKQPDWIRLVPKIYDQSRIIVGSKNYYDQWKKMAYSCEKTKALEWFQNAKFGMFVHWGIYSQAAGSWKGVKIEDSGTEGPKVAEWLMHAFQISRKQYRNYADEFEPNASFAKNFVTLAQKTGMKYMVITAKHHDGFALFDSKHSKWDIGESTLYEGDLILELYEECVKEGIGFGVYYSHGHDWMDGTDGNYYKEKAFRDSYNVHTRPNGKNLWDPSSDVFEEYLEEKAYPQIIELVKKMPKLKLIWFDGEGLITEYHAFRFYRTIYELNPNILVNRRVGYEYGDYIDAGDNKTPKAGELAPKYFETCGTANHSWGFKAHDHNWKTSPQLLRQFVDIISKGGNYLLNIGPDGMGRVPATCTMNLIEMGKWVKANEDAVYGTSRWKIFTENVQLARNAENAEGEFWFSAKGNKVYAMTLTAAPKKVEILSLSSKAGKITKLRLLTGKELKNWKQTKRHLVIDFDGVHTRPEGYVVEATFAE